MNEVGECPRCKLTTEEGVAELEGGDETPDILDQLDKLVVL
jgi:hypothetical protein